MSTPNVQLAFQGGGAKLAVMLPVADAFLTAQSRGLIKIKAVSGTSAGAICAALVATGADFSKVRTFLEDNGDVWATALVPNEIKRLAEIGPNLNLLQLFCHRKIIKNLLLHGKPALNGENLKKFLGELISAATGTQQHTIEKCASSLSIIASNIIDSKGVTHQTGELIPALMDSCALPVIFRSFDSLSSSHYVDGGLCDNLPVEGLLGDPDAPVFAIYPKNRQNEATKCDNIIAYLIALFSASISHSVSRSMAMVSSPFRFELETDLDLLDFRKAIGHLRTKDWYDSRQKDAFRRIENFAKSFGVTDAPNEARVVDVVNMELYRGALTELSDDFTNHFEVLRSRYMVRVNCDQRLNLEKEAADRASDTVTRVSVVKAISENARYYRANLMMSGDGIIPTVWSAHNTTRGTKIPIRALALGNRNQTGLSARHCVIQFIDAARHITKGDIIEIKGVYHSAGSADMRRLNFWQNDFFGFTNAQLPKIAVAELVLIYPKRIGPLQLFSHSEKCSRKSVEPMKFDDAYREVLGDNIDVVGCFTTDLLMNERLFALVTRAN